MRRGARIIGATLVAACVAASAAHALTPKDETQHALAELKRLCDDGLVSPPVCLEKQREILGLPASGDGRQPKPGATKGAAPIDGGTPYESALGFRIVLPPGWRAVDSAQLQGGFDLLRSRAAGNPDAARVVERLEQQAAQANAEVFSNGQDTVRITRSEFQLPADEEQVARFCDRLARNTEQLAARPLTTYACGPRTVGSTQAFYLERDALLPGTRTMQFWLPQASGRSLQVVLSCREGHADPRRQELEAMVGTLTRR